MRIILCVTNDVVTDRRVNRIALSLLKIPAEVSVVGIKLLPRQPVSPVPYSIYRMGMLFSKGLWFYAEYNIKLLFYLLFTRADMLVANDLDTLPAVFIASRLKRLSLVYDSHEYFTELPELVGRKWVKKTWETFEAIIVPRIRYAYTVSGSIASDYLLKYGIQMQVVRNLPFRISQPETVVNRSIRKGKEHIIIYQGSLNMGRGIELAIRAMQHMKNARLIIAGSGYLESKLRELAGNLKLNEKVEFLGRLTPEVLIHYTLQSDLGISLEERLGLNYLYALPNKLFDYIQARIPVLVSDLPEMAAVVNRYGIGKVVSTGDPYELALVFSEMLTDHVRREKWKAQLEIASKDLCWENEEKSLYTVYARAIPCQLPA